MMGERQTSLAEKKRFGSCFFVVARAVFNTCSTAAGEKHVEQTSFAKKPFATRFFFRPVAVFNAFFFLRLPVFNTFFFGWGPSESGACGAKAHRLQYVFFSSAAAFSIRFFSSRRKRFQPVCNVSP